MNQQYDIEDLKARVNILSVIENDVKLRKVKTTKNEWVGPCPFCNKGDDRFHVWPDEGRFWCRVCGQKGDILDYIEARY
jgi:DNA primase